MKKTLLLLIAISFLSINSQLNANPLKAKSTISPQNLQKAIHQLHKNLLKDLQANQKDCEVLRQKMDKLIVYLGYDPIFIVGENGKYYREGMHREFEKEPKPLQIKIKRNPMAEQLELTHIDLYHCDKNLYRRIARFANFIDNSSPQKMEDLMLVLNKRLQEFSPKVQRQLKRNKRQQVWLQNQLVQLLKLDLELEERTLLSQPIDQFIKKEVQEKTTVESPAIASKTETAKENPNHSLSLFPNPNNGHFQIYTNIEWSDQAILAITDIQGRIIFSKKLVANSKKQIEVDLREAISGVYFIQLQDSKSQWQKLFVVE